MKYITVRQHRKPIQLTWEDVIADRITVNQLTNEDSNSTGTITRKYEEISQELKNKVNVQEIIRWLKRFNEDNEKLFDTPRSELFHSFKIPKHTGGYRDIDEPLEPLMSELHRLTNYLQNDCGILYHTAAFAYIPKRSIVDHNRKHVNNKSNWYLKTDFSGFFPNTNLDFAMRMLTMIYPLSEVCEVEEGYNALRKAISLTYKADGTLPQGSPLSPFLTNTIMIPIDHRIFNEMAQRKIVYTRYADDMTISAEEQFRWMDIVKFIKEVLDEFDAPYVIKKEKTRFGSVKGNNWCLGLMCNKDYNITVGHRRKKYLKAALCSFILDTKNGKKWDIDDVMHLRGQLAYCTMVEKEYFENVVRQQNKKWKTDIKEMFRMYLA